MSNVGLDDYMQTSSQDTVNEADLRWASLPDEQGRKMSKALYILLNAVLGEGKARNIFDSCKKNEGFLVWKRLKTEYESKQGNRLTSMLTGLLSPGESWKEDAQSGKSFMTSMLAWENDIEDYIKESGKQFDNTLKVSIVLSHSPALIKDHLDNHSHSIGEDFEQLKSFVRSFCKAKQVYNRSGVKVRDDGGVRPMEIGGIEWNSKGKWHDSKGKKGKGKWSHGKDGHKGKKGKGKWDVKGKHGKHNQKGFGKGKKDSQHHGKGSGDDEYFNGECGYCGKWGHKRAQCRKLKADKEKGVAGIQSSQGSENQPQQQQQQQQSGKSVPVTGGIQYYTMHEVPEYRVMNAGDTDSEASLSARQWAADDSGSWVFGITSDDSDECEIGGIEKEGLVMLDSGSDEHVVPKGYSSGLVRQGEMGKLSDIGGGSLIPLGKQTVTHEVEDSRRGLVNMTNDFVVSQRIKRPVISMGKFVRSGGEVRLKYGGADEACGSVLLNGREIPVYLVGNSVYFRSEKKVRSKDVGGVGEEEADNEDMS